LELQEGEKGEGEGIPKTTIGTDHRRPCTTGNQKRGGKRTKEDLGQTGKENQCESGNKGRWGGQLEGTLPLGSPKTECDLQQTYIRGRSAKKGPLRGEHVGDAPQNS